MKRTLAVLSFIPMLSAPALVPAVETPPGLTDQEIIERLTRLEEGQNTLRAEIRGVEQSLQAEIRANAETIQQVRADMTQLRADMTQLRADMQEQIRQLRVDMNAQFDRIDAQFNRIDTQFDRVVRIMLGILAAFAALVATTIGFAIWDRRTMIRPFESKVREIEEAISQNRERLHSLLEAFRTLSQSDEKVAEVLRRFHLL